MKPWIDDPNAYLEARGLADEIERLVAGIAPLPQRESGDLVDERGDPGRVHRRSVEGGGPGHDRAHRLGVGGLEMHLDVPAHGPEDVGEGGPGGGEQHPVEVDLGVGQDESGDHTLTMKVAKLSGPLMLVYALSVTFAALITSSVFSSNPSTSPLDSGISVSA